jgi:hypothetical protein
MANEGFTQGFLSPTLRTGLIKLIPKGKNSSRVEDWRPITLLTTSYKIISGVVASRLEVALPYIIGRGQKGFLKYKNMGTCVQNVIDSIADSWSKREQMGSLMIDFVKAFDSIEHAFINQAMKFFGFGEIITGMVQTLLTDRRSCINLNNSHGKYFKIARGAPQGDRSSPYIFIICIEILILKLENDDSGLIKCRERIGPGNARYRECNDLIEAFADDLTVLFRWSINALGRILTILNEFGTYSGLMINMSKTSLMISGVEWEGGESVLGIKITQNCKLLGIKIDNKVSDLDRNWTECLRKIWGLIHYWSKLRLSITGRVMVAKTFLVSQATFYMGIIPLEKKRATEIDRAIGSYASGGLKFAYDRINNRIEQGGLGLIGMEELDTAIKVGWVNRWLKEGNKVDITGTLVLRLGGGQAENIDTLKLPRNKLPCAESIARAWSLFRRKYYQNESNIYGAKVFNNPEILSQIGQKIEVTVFRDNRLPLVRNSIQALKTIDLLDNAGEVKEKGEIEALIPGLTRSEFLRLRSEINWVLRKYKPRWEMRETSINIGEFLAGIKKGSKKYRAKMSGRGTKAYTDFKATSIRPVSTLWEQLGIDIDERLVSIGFTLWKMQFLDLGFREFLFKSAQGLIHGNTVISHFGNVDRKCTFCKLTGIITEKRLLRRDLTQLEEENVIRGVNDETRPHIFWECPVTSDVISHVLRNIWGNNVIIEKKSFLMGKLAHSMECTALFQLINLFIRYKIWNYKIAGTLPKKGMIVHDVENFLNFIGKKPDLRGQLPLVRQLYLENE